METRDALDEETIDALQTLIAATIDSHEGLAVAADTVDEDSLKELFEDLAAERRAQSETLQSLVRDSACEAEGDGTFGGALHRSFLALRGAINRGDPEVVVLEAERGEEAVKAAYELALRSTRGSAVSDVLHHQFAEVKKRYGQLSDLRRRFTDGDG